MICAGTRRGVRQIRYLKQFNVREHDILLVGNISHDDDHHLKTQRREEGKLEHKFISPNDIYYHMLSCTFVMDGYPVLYETPPFYSYFY
ncbi:unnamed protein product [Orchesella dallaii]|uniref:Uncharacterized protein n=1 Tax=Orchesella dallaii TaxID=48710 RepID=A0ABP1PX51_9HEXA